MLISGPTRIVFAILLFACTLATLAKAQAPLPAGVPAKPEELTLADLGAIRVDTVNGASQFVQQVIEAPSSVTIITADQIQKHGYRTMAEALGSAPGLYISNDRSYNYLGMRGFSRPGNYNNRVLVLIDGHRLNDNIYDAAFLGGAFPTDIDLIQRIEVIRGAGLIVSAKLSSLARTVKRRASILRLGETVAISGLSPSDF